MRSIILSTDNNRHFSLLLELASLLNIKVKEVSEEFDEKILTMKIAETAFSKDWNNPEEDIWDEFLKNAKDVSAG